MSDPHVIEQPAARPVVACSDLLAAAKEIEWCVDTLKQHRAHWMMTKNLNVLPSDGQCGILIKTLERASDMLKAANS
jgi:hypothetical protein